MPNKETQTGGNLFYGKLMSILMSLITMLVAGIFAFLWNLNKEFAVLQDRDIQKANDIATIQQKVNDIQLNQNALKIDNTSLNGKLDNLQFILQQKKVIR